VSIESHIYMAHDVLSFAQNGVIMKDMTCCHKRYDNAKLCRLFSSVGCKCCVNGRHYVELYDTANIVTVTLIMLCLNGPNLFADAVCSPTMKGAGFSFFVYFVLWYLSLYLCISAFVLLGRSFFNTKMSDWLRTACLKWPFWIWCDVKA